MTEAASRRPPLAYPALILGAAVLILHAFVNQHYGYFRDELYFIVCGRHPDWGYVDHPPLIPLIAGFADWAAPGSLLALRALPALMAAATVGATVMLVRLLDGGRYAQWLAGLCVLLAPIDLTFGLLLYTDLFLALAWIGCSAILIGMARTGDHRQWIWIGLIAGLALWSKYAILFNLATLALVLPFSPQLRRGLITPYPYLAAAAALAIIAPNIVWQWRHGWPFLEVGAAGVNGKNIAMSLPEYLLSQVMLQNPGAALVWVAGLAAVAFAPRWRLHRIFALQWAVLILVEVASHGKDYYPASLYPILFAFGAVAIEAACRPTWARGAVAGIVVALGATGAPMAIPLLPVDRFIAYEQALGYAPPASEHRQLTALPQLFADMFGWREMAKTVSNAYWALPAAERAQAVIKGRNYGEAAAIDLFGDRLPPAISGHNNYYLWGPGRHDGSVIIAIADDLKEAETVCASVETVGQIGSPHAMPDETELLLIICRGLKIPLVDFWPRFKNYS